MKNLCSFSTEEAGKKIRIERDLIPWTGLCDCKDCSDGESMRIMRIDSPPELSIHLMHGNRVGHWFKSCNCISLSFHSYNQSNMTNIKFYSSTQTRKVFLSSSLHFWYKLTCDSCKHNIICFYAESIIILGNWTVISKYLNPAFGSKLFTHSNHLRNVYILFLIHCC